MVARVEPSGEAGVPPYNEHHPSGDMVRVGHSEGARGGAKVEQVQSFYQHLIAQVRLVDNHIVEAPSEQVIGSQSEDTAGVVQKRCLIFAKVLFEHKVVVGHAIGSLGRVAVERRRHDRNRQPGHTMKILLLLRLDDLAVPSTVDSNVHTFAGFDCLNNGDEVKWSLRVTAIHELGMDQGP